MIKIARGGMVGRVGSIVWCNGSDMNADDCYNTLVTRGACRFGNLAWWPPGRPNVDALYDFLGLA